MSFGIVKVRCRASGSIPVRDLRGYFYKSLWPADVGTASQWEKNTELCVPDMSTVAKLFVPRHSQEQISTTIDMGREREWHRMKVIARTS
jgi:hypothetical protein